MAHGSSRREEEEAMKDGDRHRHGDSRSSRHRDRRGDDDKDKERRKQISSTRGNDVCADCPSTKPLWVSFLKSTVPTKDGDGGSASGGTKEIFVAVLVCPQCAQHHHFELGTKRCRIKNFKMQHEWSSEDILILRDSGNHHVNSIWEASLTEKDFDKKLVLSDTEEENKRRAKFIKHKYKREKYHATNGTMLMVAAVGAKMKQKIKQKIANNKEKTKRRDRRVTSDSMWTRKSKSKQASDKKKDGNDKKMEQPPKQVKVDKQGGTTASQSRQEEGGTTANHSRREEGRTSRQSFQQRGGYESERQGTTARDDNNNHTKSSGNGETTSKELHVAVLVCASCAQHHHFELGTKRCRIKYAKMQHEWTPEDITILQESGNDHVNSIWEATLTQQDFDKQLVLSNKEKEKKRRAKFIRHKYKKEHYHATSSTMLVVAAVGAKMKKKLKIRQKRESIITWTRGLKAMPKRVHVHGYTTLEQNEKQDNNDKVETADNNKLDGDDTKDSNHNGRDDAKLN
ncbi:ArfGAP with dual PH domains [Seminavis robusta]|uniref:ArfGAP with dual PH domains n=1 Tax=Seminavis robusta TaxID=568900 RepID=A0A9N8HER1_9STRA|nr:ArfGAP with dual PH domains [Seminavis robusta]|eukprot:Sro396_g134370.1 ArfGAP with dual PH domains (513) ;mRNA; f:63013-64833